MQCRLVLLSKKAKADIDIFRRRNRMGKVTDRFKNIGTFIPQQDDEIIICRCEEITKGEIRQAVHEGMFTLTEIRRYLRTGMGLCQGQTCGRLVKGIVAKELGISPYDLEPATSRAPMRPIEMIVYANEEI
jgi:NAD(P)H-nitrite reductase large subunit